MTKNPLLKLKDYGQSVWLDFLSREILDSGKLKRLIDEDGLSGVTSNPSIFKKAIADSDDYDDAIRDLVQQDCQIEEIYQTIVVEDIQRAADLLRPTYDASAGRHGFVSLEVSPHLAYETDGTIEEARRLWAAVERPNVFIKVPATLDGLPAIQQLISEGININVTLLFGLPRYQKVAEAYIAGIENRVKAGQPVDSVASVASFFLSRIDVLVDPILESYYKKDAKQADLARKLHGQVAIASAKIAYQMYKDIFNSSRFKEVAKAGAKPQRVLWASTSTKNPAYSDVKYIEALIGPETINTMPLDTLDAYRDHGQPALRLEDGVAEAHRVLNDLSELGLTLAEVTQQLEEEGVQKFNDPFDILMETLEKKCEQYRAAEPI
ncbi:MAG: transaldolase [Anaerolineae bacterium]|nr:transaldolase [Anaerolineae bacterium]